MRESDINKYIALVIAVGVLLIVVFAIIYDKFDVLSPDEKQYIKAMRGSEIERHVGFWLPARLFYNILGSIGPRMYNALLYIISAILITVYSRNVREPNTRLIIVSSFSLNPFVIYFTPRILSEPSSYTFLLMTLIFATNNSFLSGFFFGLGFISKYYLIITVPFIISLTYYYYYRSNIRQVALFTIGAVIPLIGIFAYSYIITGDTLYVFKRAGPELYVPLNERHFIIRSLILSLISIFLVSIPFTKNLISSLLKALEKDKIIILGFVFMFLANVILGFFHITGMKDAWRYKDHIRLASVSIPTFTFTMLTFPPKKASKRYIIFILMLSIIIVILLSILRLKAYNII